MLNNLRTALYRKGISVKQYAEILGVGEKNSAEQVGRKNGFYISRVQKNLRIAF